MNEDVGMFLFLAAGSVGLFAFLSVANWVNTRAAERIERDRFALLKKLAEMPPDAAGLVLAQLRDDDARREQKERVKAERGRGDARQIGLILLAAGIGFSIFLRGAVPVRPVWTLGLIPMLIGLVIFGYTFFGTHDRPR